MLAGAVLLAAALTVLAGFPGVAPVGAFMNDDTAAVAPTGPQLMAVSATLGARTTTITIEASDPVAYLMSQPDPFTVLVDLRNARAGGAANHVQGRFGLVAGVSVEEATMSDGAPSARIRVRLTELASYNVRSARNIIVVEIGKPASTNDRESGDKSPSLVAPAVAASAPETGRASLPLATWLSGVRTSLDAQSAVVTLKGNGRLVAATVEEARDAPPRVIVDFPNVRPLAPSVTDVGQGPITRIRVGVNSRNPLVTRVVVDLNRRSSYWVQPPEDDSSEFRIVFDNAPEVENKAPLFMAQIGKPRPLAPDPMTALTLRLPGSDTPSPDASLLAASAPAPASLATTASVVSAFGPSSAVAPKNPPQAALAQAPASQPAPSAAPTPSATPPPVASTPPAQSATPGTIAGQLPSQGRTYSGTPVSLDFQGSDLRAVLRTFQEVSGLNMIIDPAVQGSVDIALKDVPWDQALDNILRTNKLGYAVDGTIVRIAPLSVLADEAAQQRKLAEEQALSGELRVFTRSLSYAKAEELQALLTKTALTARGTVQVDPRTNTLIITDLPSALQTAGDLIGALDRPQPQVEIEARIVQTTREFARSLGVQWGFNGRLAQDLGNTTGLAFPNTGSLTGRTGVVQGPVKGSGDDGTRNPGTVVNLGVEGPGSAIGLALGSVNGSVNLDLALSALERAGQGRLLSTPRVSTQNNVEAEITQGVQIPIQTVANNTVTVSFKDAALTLKVTPQITAANTVIMRIWLENASPDFSRSIKDIPPIDTQRAISQVLVSDGQTTVIGGIYVSREQAAEDRTPGLHRLPLLGWLFRREAIRDESRELLIFITPRIVKT